jgi:serine/threonine protein kinase
MGGAGSLADLQDEYEAMQLLACKNIAKSYEIFQDQHFVYMVNEVYLGGDMTSLKRKATMQMGALTEDWWKGVFRQCFEALEFMHKQAMMHCDVKEPNMMLRTDNYAAPQVVLIDFGISKAMTKSVGAMVSGTPGYMPPETMNTGKWFPGGDVFSLGVAIYQLLTDQVPDDEAAKRGAPMIGLFLNGATTLEDVQRFVNTRQPDFFRIQMPGLRRICQRCLEKNMRNRPRAPALIKDGWFSGMAPGTAHFYNNSPATQALGQAYSAPVATCFTSSGSYCPPPTATPVAPSYAAPIAYSAPVVSSSYVAPAPGYSTTVPVASSLGPTRSYSATLPVASSLGTTRGYSATIPAAPSYAPSMPYATPRPGTPAYASPMVPSYSMPGRPCLPPPAVIV